MILSLRKAPKGKMLIVMSPSIIKIPVEIYSNKDLNKNPLILSI